MNQVEKTISHLTTFSPFGLCNKTRKVGESGAEQVLFHSPALVNVRHCENSLNIFLLFGRLGSNFTSFIQISVSKVDRQQQK